MAELLLTAIEAGYKANEIALLCREDSSLFSILVQEKGILQDFRIDFKTLADVLIQQVIVSELENKFSGIGKRVFGEENNQFTNTLGETITVEIKKTCKETTEMLSHVLDGNPAAARSLAEAAHLVVPEKASNSYVSEETLGKIGSCNVDIDKVAFWVDPIVHISCNIFRPVAFSTSTTYCGCNPERTNDDKWGDATYQYVKGYDEEINEHGVCTRGLPCVTVLIGAYHVDTGLPILGVVFQPFHEKIAEPSSGGRKWKSKCYWGFSHGSVNANNFTATLHENTLKREEATATDDDAQSLLVVSGTDRPVIDAVGADPRLASCSAGGAGYKALCVGLGLVDGYVFSGTACYKWDTCATQALLASCGSGIASLEHVQRHLLAGGGGDDDAQLIAACEAGGLRNHQPNPAPATSPWANCEGLVAYLPTASSLRCVRRVLRALRK